MLSDLYDIGIANVLAERDIREAELARDAALAAACARGRAQLVARAEAMFLAAIRTEGLRLASGEDVERIARAAISAAVIFECQLAQLVPQERA